MGATRNMKPEAPRPVLLADYRPPDFLIDVIDLDIKLDPHRTRIKAKSRVRRNDKASNANAAAKLTLDGEYLELEAIAVNGKALTPEDYDADDTSLTLHAVPKKPFTLEITTIVSPEANTALQGIYLSRGTYCSQCEAQGFRRITYFIDRPDVLSVYSVRLEADVATCPVLLANGNLSERGTLDGGKSHYAVWRDPHPKPCYLFAVVGGNLSPVASAFKTMSGRNVDLRIYVEHGKEARAHWAMDALKRAMAWDEKRFGREYDLEVFNIVAVADFNMGAMENKGLNIFNDRLILASAETATDNIYEAIESVVAHEYFHNWTGNRITCRDWFQLCLKEGLTVYRDQEFSGDERSPTVQRIADVRQLRALQFPEDQGPMAHPVRPESYIEINNFYTPTIYEKGAELVRMIETILGRAAFKAGMDLYFERHDGDAATIEDFLACFEDASGVSLEHFKCWYEQSGTPELFCEFRYDKATKTAELKVQQILRPTPGQPKKKPLYIPLRIGLIGGNGQEMQLDIDDGSLIGKDVVAITKRKQTIRFNNVASRPVPSLLRSFSAPVNLSLELSDEDIGTLIMNDRDLFNRWQATNAGLVKAVLSVMQAKGERSKGLILANAIKSILEDNALEDAYKAEVIKLPSESDIAREVGTNVDPNAIRTAFQYYSKWLAEQLAPVLEPLYMRKAPAEPYDPNAKSAGRRALRNAALTLLTARTGQADLERLETHFVQATNMTDASCALMLLAGIECEARDRALASFYDRWKADHLVIDTWFAAQAQAPLVSTLPNVKALMKHPLFKITTPNKVRALIGTFATANPTQFNRPDGAGYDFVAATALDVDRINPQVAARLLGAFRSYTALEPVRRAKAKAALQSVADTAKISRDLREIATRMLDA
jgi:aminopeptidase N